MYFQIDPAYYDRLRVYNQTVFRVLVFYKFTVIVLNLN